MWRRSEFSHLDSISFGCVFSRSVGTSASFFPDLLAIHLLSDQSRFKPAPRLLLICNGRYTPDSSPSNQTVTYGFFKLSSNEVAPSPDCTKLYFSHRCMAHSTALCYFSTTR
eukprot:Gb_14109 [translate_table: standard]